jgi:ubiquinone/menaquinone biosynthesis C-methylase UbiE
MSDASQVSDYFTRAAAMFDSLYSENRMNPLMRFINRHFRRDIYERYLLSLDHIHKHGVKTMLDVGCGSGRYAVGFVEAGVEHVTGIDFSPTMIELAKMYARKVQTGDEKCSFHCCDFTAFSTEMKFDAVLSMGFFDYIKEPVPVLRKMRELSTHSVIASFPSISFYRTPLRKIRYRFKRCPVYFYTTAMITSLARDAGFVNCDITKIRGAGMDYFVVFS